MNTELFEWFVLALLKTKTIKHSDFQKNTSAHELRYHCMHNLFTADELLFRGSLASHLEII